ncbi:MAG: glycosyltransferase [Pirellulaceae bacterium]
MTSSTASFSDASNTKATLHHSAKILFHTYNRRGLGHLMRGFNIASQLKALAPQTEITFFAKAARPEGFHQLDCHYVHEMDDSAERWNHVLDCTSPDVVVLDTVLPKTEEIRSSLQGVKVAYIMRKCAAVRQQQVLQDPLVAASDLIIVPHERAEFDISIPCHLQAKTHFVGAIVRPHDARQQRRLTENYNLHQSTFTLVSTPGGGGFQTEADEFLQTVSDVHDALHSRQPQLKHIVVLGPNYSGSFPPRPGMIVVSQEPDLVHLMPLSHLFLSAGGYNTVTELRATKTPAVFIPSPRTHDDQRDRVTRLAQSGLAAVVQPGPNAAHEIMTLCDDQQRIARMRAALQQDHMRIGNHDAAALILELAAK